MYHSAIWRADDPEHPAARESTQSGGTIDKECLKGSHAYNGRPSLPEPDNVLRVHLPTPAYGRSFTTDIPRVMSGPSNRPIDIPGISSSRTRDNWWQGGNDHGPVWDERNRSRERIRDDHIPMGRKPSTPSGFPRRFRLPPIHTLKGYEPLLGKPTGFGAHFSVNAPQPQLRTSPRSWHNATTKPISHPLKLSETTYGRHFVSHEVHGQPPLIRDTILPPRTIQSCESSDRSSHPYLKHHSPRNGSSPTRLYYGHQPCQSQSMSSLNRASPTPVDPFLFRQPKQARVGPPSPAGTQSRRLANLFAERKRRECVPIYVRISSR
jgi:hypothetical protein